MTETPTPADAFKVAQTRHRKSSELLLDEIIDFGNPPSSSSSSSSGGAASGRIVRLPNPDAAAADSDRGGRRRSCVDEEDPERDGGKRTGGRRRRKKRSRYEGPTLYGLSSHPGFVFVPGALSPELRLRLAHRALSEYCERPHGTNIDLVPIKDGVEVEDDPSETMWDRWKRENGFVGRSEEDGPSAPSGGAGGGDVASGGGAAVRRRCDDETQRSERARKHRSASGRNREETNAPRPYRTMKKLSWSTVGYHYDWTARSYRECSKSPMPGALSSLSVALAGLSRPCHRRGDGGGGDDGRASDWTFEPSAAIVNYYGPKQIMGGHRDDLELDFAKPVVSISLGLPAIFLLGGTESRDEAPAAILVRPGDVMLLGGKSRLCYHGMTRVIPGGTTVPPPAAAAGGGTGESSTEGRFWIEAWEEEGEGRGVGDAASELDVEAVVSYLSNHRINVNVRQVLPDGVERIEGDGADA